MRLQNKRIAITGAFGILGSAAVEAALAEGASVIAIDYASANLAPSFDGQVKILGACDLTNQEQAEQALGAADAAFGGLDALLNIAGGFSWETVADGSIDTWESMFNINVRTAVLASKAALPYLTKHSGSAIVNIGANGAVKAGAGLGAYAASKSGVARFTESLAEEVKQQGVRVNAVLPSIIDTPINRADMPDADFAQWVTPEELANVLIFLTSDQASGVTGALVPVVGRV
jgi:NAD(P)-dependent dehydrogenase (short-subunit alcohol dehydrogenase family)